MDKRQRYRASSSPAGSTGVPYSGTAVPSVSCKSILFSRSLLELVKDIFLL